MKRSTVAIAETLATLKLYPRFGLEFLDDRILKVTGLPIPSSFYTRSLNSGFSRFAMEMLRRSPNSSGRRSTIRPTRTREASASRTQGRPENQRHDPVSSANPFQGLL